jgi:hypothetical protein
MTRAIRRTAAIAMPAMAPLLMLGLGSGALGEVSPNSSVVVDADVVGG